MVIKLKESYNSDGYCTCPWCGEQTYVDSLMPYCEECGAVIDLDECDDFEESCHDMEEGIFSKKGNDASDDLKFKQSSIQVMKIGNALLQLAGKANTTADANSLMSGLKDAKKEIDGVISDLK